MKKRDFFFSLCTEAKVRDVRGFTARRQASFFRGKHCGILKARRGFDVLLMMQMPTGDREEFTVGSTPDTKAGNGLSTPSHHHSDSEMSCRKRMKWHDPSSEHRA